MSLLGDGIKDMGYSMLIVIDDEAMAVTEANRLGIPVVRVFDSNASPDGVDFPIGENDDTRYDAFPLYCVSCHELRSWMACNRNSSHQAVTPAASETQLKQLLLTQLKQLLKLSLS